VRGTESKTFTATLTIKNLVWTLFMLKAPITFYTPNRPFSPPNYPQAKSFAPIYQQTENFVWSPIPYK